MGTKPAQLAIRHTKFNIDVLSSHVLLAAIEEALEPGDEFKLQEVLNPLKPSYDYILIDTPPGKAMLAFNGLAAADLIIIPASAERMAVDGVADLINHVQKIMWNKYALTHQELTNTLYHVPIYHFSLPCHCCQCAENLAREYFNGQNPPLDHFQQIL